MAMQYSVAFRGAALDQIETVLGVSAKLRIYSGAVPANTAAAATGTLLADITMASDWAAAASAGSKALSGVPLNTTAAAAGTAGYFRFVDSAGTTTTAQGTVTATGGGGDLTFDNPTFTLGQALSITGFTFTMAGA